MSSSVVNDFLSALFDNTISSETEVSISEPPSTVSAPAASTKTDGAQAEHVAAGVKRQREEEHESALDHPDPKLVAMDGTDTKPVQTKEHQPTKKTTAPKPQYQPFQQQLLGSTAMSDPYDAYLVSSKLNNLQTASPPAKAAKASSTGSSNSRHDKDGRGKNTSKDSHPSHPYHASNSVIDKLPAESRMFIKKLPHSITHDEIVDHFSKYGKILEVVPKSGFGFVQFESVDACQKAVENENGKAFKTVELVLEPCHKRPHDSRQGESESAPAVHPRNNRKPDNRKPNPPIKNTFSAGARPPTGQPAYIPYDKSGPNRGQWSNRQSNFNHSEGQGSIHAGGYGNNRHNYRDDAPHRNRPQENYDHQRQHGNNRHQRAAPEPNRRQPASLQKSPYRQHSMLPKGPKSSYWPPQRRYGQAVPVVELVVWDNVPDSFIAYIEGRFRAKKLQLHTSYLQQNDVDKDTLMQHFVMEGVTAVIMVDRNDEVRGKVYMQVFERSGAADTSNVRFDEYAGISVDDAVSVVARANDKTGRPSSNSMMLTQSYSQVTPPQAPRRPIPLDTTNVQQPQSYGYGAPQSQMGVPSQTSVAPAVDMNNAVAALLGIVQNVAQPNMASDPGVNNAALQLLTTLVNNSAVAPNPTPLNQQASIPQQYDPAYSQLSYNPSSSMGYNSYSQSSASQMAYATTKPAVDNDAARMWQTNNHNQNQNSKYYPNYANTSIPPPTTAAPPAASTNVGEILAKLQMLQQQGQQK